MEKTKKSFSDLKVGDLVLYITNWGIGVNSVSKITKKYIFCGDEPFFIENGKVQSYGKYDTTRIVPATKEEIDHVINETKKSLMIYDIKRIKWQEYPKEVLQQVLELTKREKK